MGKVVSVNISEKKGTVKTPADHIVLIEEFGVECDAHASFEADDRQVSFLAEESIKKVADMGIDGLTPGIFAENVTTSGIVLYTLPIGTRLKIGDTIQEVSKIGKECHHGCEIMKKTGTCIMPKEGIFTRVIKGGTVRPGDNIEILSN